MTHSDTIAAIATPLGIGGISIIKISGPEAVASVVPLFQPKNSQRALHQLASQTMIYGHIHDDDNGDLIDEVLLSILRSPRSFTGEDVVEINCHGGIQVTMAVLEMLLKRGVRLAEPGEFTRRAFMNGRIDLTQVEGTIDLIHARTKRAARLGSQMIASGIGAEIQRLLDIVIETRAMAEATIDFCDDMETELPTESLKMKIIEEVIPALEKLVANYQGGRLLREGLRVVLAGKPNVGKSSLMNQLLDQDRVLVTDVPGTTRDTVEEGIEIEGIPIRICDTAGLARSKDPIERLGQQRTMGAIENADIILFMIDASQPLDESDCYLEKMLEQRDPLVLRNKIDLVADTIQPTTLDKTPAQGYLDISALYGKGMKALKKRLLAAAGVDQSAEANAFLPNLRQKTLLFNALAVLSEALEHTPVLDNIDTLAMDLAECERLFNQVLGNDVEQDVLDTIFERFCIGK